MLILAVLVRLAALVTLIPARRSRPTPLVAPVPLPTYEGRHRATVLIGG